MEIVEVTSRDFKEIVEISARLIKKGKVLVCPTDTVYGLLADARDEKAVKRVFKIKKRPEEKPIPIFVKDMKMAKKLAYINEFQVKFLKKVWFTRPNFEETWAGKGKVTVVLKRKNNLPRILFGKEKTIGLRIPNYSLVNILLERLNFPLTGTSANISGKLPSIKIKEIINQFQNERFQPDLVLDASNLKHSLPSTVIDLTSNPPKILREGAVSTEKIRALF